jgi:allophanate hydrolase
MEQPAVSITPPTGRTAAEWSAAFREDFAAAADALRALHHTLDSGANAWISRIDAGRLETEIDRLRALPPQLPLYGAPFAVKDNIDAAGWPTTAGCPDFAYQPAASAGAVTRLEAAGAVLMGKTNLDQFATGLAGTRSAYGAVANPFNRDYVAGGSSSGSAVAVAEGRVPLALGTDTSGSGRIPAGFNNLVGLKPTLGRCSRQGIVPGCLSLEGIAIFALTPDDAATALDVVEGHDPSDPWSRSVPSPEPPPELPIRLAIPRSAEWFGDHRAELAWLGALAGVESMGMKLQPVDFTPLFELASLLYHGPWVAERHAALGPFVQARPESVHPIVRSIILRGGRFSASEAFQAQHRRKELLRDVQALFERHDALLVPTSPTHPTLAAVAAEPLEQDSRLGRYASFVNLADGCAIALPAGFRADGLPFGITLIAPAWRDRSLLAWARAWQRHAPWLRGATGIPAPMPPEAAGTPGTAGTRPASPGPYLRLPPRRGRQQQSFPLDN